MMRERTAEDNPGVDRSWCVAAPEITGWECLLDREPAGPDPVGTCVHYRVIVTDGASKGLVDTFCGGHADVTAVNDPRYCPYVWKVDKGDIRIWSGS